MKLFAIAIRTGSTVSGGVKSCDDIAANQSILGTSL